MTPLPRLRRGVSAALMALAFVLQGTISVLAGTTGTISGSVVDPQSNQPVAGARVTAVSPSQSATTTSDTSGRFSFISLAPDTYTVSVPATDTRDAASVSGITVQADQTISVALTQPSKLKVIGAVTSRAASALVKPGTTADVYSINPLTQDKASPLGGGGTLNSAWSAISSVPGVFVAPNQGGYIGAGPTLSIRGGDYNQVGYEVDGVPVNRSFDNYPSGSLSSLGQQELQVYTGATPANAEASGLSGYINQVIRTGTSPATRNLTLAIGTPALYNKIAFEAGGANPARTFSYYLGAGAFNQAFRYYDQYNGASLQQVYGMPVSTCPAAGTPGFTPGSSPGCFGPNGVPYTNTAATPSYVLSPYVNDSIAGVRTRDTVLNVHFGIPQKNGNKDDVQVLFDNNFIENSYYNSTNDQGGAAFLAFNGATGCPVGSPCYADGNVLTGIPRATVLPVGFTGAPGAVSYYLFPDSPGGRALASSIAPDRRDAFNNNQSIVKVQYQKNFGTSAFLRVYGYTYYSDWLQNGPQSAQQIFLGAIPSQYLLSSHTRGVSATFSDQLNSQHLLTAQAAYVTATSLRDNNTSGGLGPLGLNSSPVAYLVNGNNPYNGICYTAGGTQAPGCNFGTLPFQTFTFNNLRNNTVVQPTPGATCGGGPCQYVVVNDGIRASYNSIVPKFYSASLTDQFTPTSRLHVNLGLRFDRFEFHEPSTFDSNARTLYYNAYNLVPHPTGPLTNSDINGNVAGFSVWQPRVGLTYSLNPATVIRASYGRYAQPPNAAFEQYNFLQANSIPNLLGFQAVGLPATPSHVIRPEISNNYDLSFEHQFGRDTSIKVTPFLRKTQDQIQQFYLDPKVNFVSGLNVGRQTSQGVEFEADKGDFSRNGIAARVTFTYTNSYITYGNSLPNGQSVISNFNTAI
ncbi:MAG: hypothetical protein JWO66_168, partial [Candidatus Eremiobacteraeota bacterium]|nr:hypothetical protein [Candidatus Eremiobacteraeota bacterium]